MRIALLALLAIAACGGSNSSTPIATPTGAIGPSQIGANFESGSGTYSTSVDGQDYEVSVNRVINGQPFFVPQTIGTERTVYIGIQGANVDGFAGSRVDGTNDVSTGFFGITGTPTVNALNGTITYSGKYSVADATDPFYSLLTQDAELTVDFGTGSISGGSVNDLIVSHEMTLTGSFANGTATLTINDDFGTHVATGGVYGENGEEFAAGFNDGSTVGLLYGER